MTEDAWTNKILRVGRKLGRTIYVQEEDAPDDKGWVIGMVDTKELAAEIARRWNAFLPDAYTPKTNYIRSREKELEEQLDRAARNDLTREKQITSLRMRVDEKDARIATIKKEMQQRLDITKTSLRSAQEERDELRQVNSKLLQDLQQAGVHGRKVADREWSERLMVEQGAAEARVRELEEVIERLSPKPAEEAGSKSAESAVADFASSVAAGIRKIRETIEDADDKGYIEFLEEKIKEKDRRIENMIGELAGVLMQEFPKVYDKDESITKQVIMVMRGQRDTIKILTRNSAFQDEQIAALTKKVALAKQAAEEMKQIVDNTP